MHVNGLRGCEEQLLNVSPSAAGAVAGGDVTGEANFIKTPLINAADHRDKFFMFLFLQRPEVKTDPDHLEAAR